ncbi:MAG: hypothetical protein LBM97_01605 [Candidatus Nomurabacteria bacterium]|jgi:hypothetical protein|nr:hypothetical protein [Candidatus Nomurabacteria bacterium]
MQPKTIWQVLAEHRKVLLIIYTIFAVAIIILAIIGLYRHFTSFTKQEITTVIDPISGVELNDTGTSYPDAISAVTWRGFENLAASISQEQINFAKGRIVDAFIEQYAGEELTLISLVHDTLTQNKTEAGFWRYSFRTAFNNDITNQAVINIILDTANGTVSITKYQE